MDNLWIWLVVEPPLRNIWLRQLGWWHSQLFLEKYKSRSKPPTRIFSPTQKKLGIYSRLLLQQSNKDHRAVHTHLVVRIPTTFRRTPRSHHPAITLPSSDLILSKGQSLDGKWGWKIPRSLENISGWCLTYPSEEYWSVGMIIPNIWENKKCSKPRTRYLNRLSFDHQKLSISPSWFMLLPASSKGSSTARRPMVVQCIPTRTADNKSWNALK